MCAVCNLCVSIYYILLFTNKFHLPSVSERIFRDAKFDGIYLGSRLGMWGSDLLLLFDRSPSLRYVGYVAGLLHIPWNILNIYWIHTYIFKMPLHYMHIYIICTRYLKYFAIILSLLYFVYILYIQTYVTCLFLYVYSNSERHNDFLHSVLCHDWETLNLLSIYFYS